MFMVGPTSYTVTEEVRVDVHAYRLENYAILAMAMISPSLLI